MSKEGHKVVTMEKAVHALFFNVDTTRVRNGRVEVNMHPMNDPEVKSVTLCLSKARASELGLIAA